MKFEAQSQKVVETEVAIIGGGIMGLASAYSLAKRGKQVALLERQSFGWEASGRSAGGVRQRGRDPRELPLAMASVSLWSDLEDELGAEIHYRRGGNISVALTDEELEILALAAAEEQSIGLTVKTLGREELRELVPALSDRCLGANYCPTDGYAEPEAVVSAYVGAAERAGVGMYPRTEVLDFTVEAGRVSSIFTEQIEFRPQVTVNAAGPWAHTLAMRVGLVVPLWPGRAQLVETEPVGPLFEQFLVFEGERVYCRPTLDGRVHYGSITWVSPADVEYPPTLNPATDRAAGLASVVPALEGVPVHRTWSGLLDMTPDGVPIIGSVPGLKDYVIAAGFCGHGFCLGPIVGKLLAEHIVDGCTSLPLDELSLTRFAAELAF